MRSFVYFLAVLHITMGQIQNVYDVQRCGKSQIDDYAQNSLGKRVRRSSMADAQSIDRTTSGYVTHENLDENAIWDQDEDENATWDQDDNDFMQEKVMGGRRAERGEIPWAVLLRTPGDLCGGTLVSRRHVITAAHCFWASNRKMGKCNISDMYSQENTTNSTEVYVGGSCSFAGAFGCDTSDIGKKYRVARASYEQYFAYGCKGTHDIAILELTEDVPKTINHVCLPFMHQLEEIEDPYLKLRSFGWGLDPLKYPGIPSPYLQVADLGAKLPEQKCNRMKKWKANDTFCTASGPQYICQGDSGGGVTATVRKRDYMMGIISFGPNCIRVAKGKAISHPQVSTDIMHYKETIKSWILTKSENQSIDYSHYSHVSNPPLSIPYPLSQPVTNHYRRAQNSYGSQASLLPTNINYPQSQPVTNQYGAQYQYSSQASNSPNNINYPPSQPVTNHYGAQYQYGSQVSNPLTSINYPRSQPVTNQYRITLSLNQ